jgi:RHS repeat-associated protein
MDRKLKTGLWSLALAALWMGGIMPWSAQGVNPSTSPDKCAGNNSTPDCCQEKCGGDEDCLCQCNSGGGGSLIIEVSMGQAARTGVANPGQLFIHYEQPDNTLFSPVGLSYTMGAKIVSISSVTNASGGPAKVTLFAGTKSVVDYTFANGSSAGLPSGKYFNLKTKLLMVDTNGQPVVAGPAYYDLVYPDSHRDRMSAKGSNRGQLIGIFSAQGRFNTLADSGIDAIVNANGVLRQVKAPSRFADIVAYTNSPGYEIRFYSPSQVSAGPTAGVYQVSGTPYCVWTVEKPDASTIDKVRITMRDAGQTLVYNGSYADYTKCWTVDMGNGLKTESKSTTWDDAHVQQMDTQILRSQATPQVRKTVTLYRVFTWGEGVVSNIVDPDGAAQTTSTAYYSAASETGRYGRVITSVNPDGSWFKYDYDAQGRQTLELRSWKDAPLSSASSANARARTMDYTPLDAADVLAFNDQRPRTETESIAGTPVGQTFHVYKTVGGQTIEIEEKSATPGAGFGAAGNQRTTYTYYANSDSFRAGLLASAQYSDGRQDTYDYEGSSYSGGTTNPGVVAAGGGSFTRETVVHGTAGSPQGVANLTTKDVVVKDPQGNVVLKETYVCTGGGYARIGWTMQTFDEIGNLTTKSFSNGTQASSQWCGRTKLSDVDTRGIEIDYGYDALGRVVARTKKGVPAYGGYAMQDDVTTALALDVMGQTLAETYTAAGLTQATSREFDGAGRATKATDAAGLATITAYANGGRTVTVTQPGGATVITENYLDGRAKSVTGTGVIASAYDYGVNGDGTQWTCVYSSPAGLNSLVWQRTTSDALGHVVKVEKPAFGGGTLTTLSTYNVKGQLVSTQTAPMPATRYVYDDVGNVTLAGVDVDGSGSLDVGGTDRVTGSATHYVQADDKWWQETTQVVYPVNGSGNGVTVSTRRTDVGGSGCGCAAQEVRQLDVRGNETRSTVDITPGLKLERHIVKYPDSTTSAVNVLYNGLLVSRISKTGVTVNFTSDSLGRQISQTLVSVGGARTVASTAHYDFRGWVDSVTDAAGNQTQYLYDDATGRRISVKDALQQTVNTEYDVMGRPTRIWGATYPVAYEYDDFGRMTALKTYRQESSAPDVTTWIYDQATGLQTRKLYADGNGPSYSYDALGQLTQRTWARGVTTTYAYDSLGQLTGTTYSDGTPAVSFTLDRLGRQTQAITAGVCTNGFAYDNATLSQNSETQISGFMSQVLTRTSDAFGRPAGISLGPDYSVGYGYDAYGRFSSVSSSVASAPSVANYSYLPGSDLIAQLATDNGLLTTKVYEPNRDLITAVVNTIGGNLVSRFDYANDVLGRRTQRIDSGSATNIFGYNARSELTSAAMGANNYGYQYDAIGNRQTSVANGLVSTYTANLLNQYTSIADASNSSTPSYDLDGNMTTNGVWSYTWDSENRLVSAASNGVTVVQNLYDHKSRRIAKITASTTTAFLYDDWNLVSETQVSGLTPQVSYYVWGLDLSGSLQGAGGVGGLLCKSGTGVSPVFYTYDANGNVTDLIDSSGAVAAHYEYDAFGNTTAVTGDRAAANPFRFSTKYFDAETGLYYYGYRYYLSSLGCWLARDMIYEKGGLNLYSIARNAAVNFFDKYGLCSCTGCVAEQKAMGDAVDASIAAMKLYNTAQQQTQDALTALSKTRKAFWRDYGKAFAACGTMALVCRNPLLRTECGLAIVSCTAAWATYNSDWDEIDERKVVYNGAVKNEETALGDFNKKLDDEHKAIEDFTNCMNNQCKK